MFGIHVILSCALLAYLGCTVNGQGCVTEQSVQAVDTDVMTLIQALSTSGLATLGSDNSVTIPDENVPPLLELLCNTTANRDIMTSLQTALQNCPGILINSTNLKLLEIKGESFATLFAVFTSVDNFCECQPSLPHAWALKAQAQADALKHMDGSAAYTNIAAVDDLCGAQLKAIIMSVTADSASCKQPLAAQAGYVTDTEMGKLNRIKMVVDTYCTNFVAADWTCATTKAMTTEFKTCIQDKANLSGEKASCEKRDCVKDEMDCTANAKAMYIHAVNVEMAMEIKEQDCNSASGLQLPMVTIVVAAFVTMFY